MNSHFDLVPNSVYHVFHDSFEQEQYREFLYRFQKILWFSYRKNFQPILKSNFKHTREATAVPESFYELVKNVKSEIRIMHAGLRLTFTNDEGWGCMLRCSQMMLAETLSRTSKFKTSDRSELINLFLDCEKFPFSIHQLVLSGNKFGKIPGEWYGPSTVSHVLKERVTSKTQELGYLEVLIVDQGNIYEDQLKTNQLILVPHRLGIDSINSEYWNDIKCLLGFPSSVGILGGTPGHALYIVGQVEKPGSFIEINKLICLDPHKVQNVEMSPDSLVETYTCKDPKQVNMVNLDPSLAFGFYLDKNPDSIEIFKSLLLVSSSNIITLEKTEPTWRVEESVSVDEFELI
jgi:cysteine protease ATG4